LPDLAVNRRSTPKGQNNEIASLADAVLDVNLALRQRARDLNRENHLRTLQTALHADSENVWNMTLWYW
jgi:hypothetical protein